MTELDHAPANYGEQEKLPLEFETPEAGVVPSAAPVDVTEDVTHSPAYHELVELRDGAYARHRSGARAIARLALTARREGKITPEEHADLFPISEDGIPSAAPQLPPHFDDYAISPPPREPDWAERAAGEAARHAWDDQDD